MKKLILGFIIGIFFGNTAVFAQVVSFGIDFVSKTIIIVNEELSLEEGWRINSNNEWFVVIPELEYENLVGANEEDSAGDDEAEFDEFRAVVMNSPVGSALRCRASTDTSSTNNIVVAMTNGTTATVVDIFRDGRHEWWQLEDIVTANGEEIEGPCVAASGTDSEKWLDLIAED